LSVCTTAIHIAEEIPVVPECRGPRRPSESDLNINIVFVDIKQIIQYQIALSFVQAYNLSSPDTVYEQALPSSCRVYTHDWMDSFHWSRACGWVIAV
jgi:hypothetical protein